MKNFKKVDNRIRMHWEIRKGKNFYGCHTVRVKVMKYIHLYDIDSLIGKYVKKEHFLANNIVLFLLELTFKKLKKISKVHFFQLITVYS